MYRGYFYIIFFIYFKLEGNRSKALYLSNLPGNTTQQKMDAMFEMEADCNIDEVCLMKVNYMHVVIYSMD
jgi:hypothetical protein